MVRFLVLQIFIIFRHVDVYKGYICTSHIPQVDLLRNDHVSKAFIYYLLFLLMATPCISYITNCGGSHFNC